MPIHNFLDSTKAALPDVRHRMILHNSFGCFLAEQVFGTNLVTFSHEKEKALREFKNNPSQENYEKYKNLHEQSILIPNKKMVSVRDVAEDHVKEDLRIIPTIEQCLKGLPIMPWMAGGVAKYSKESEPQPVD